MPITTWRFKTQAEGMRHMGPMAQDFRAAFGLGTDDASITKVDVNGAAVAAIQGLHAEVEQQAHEIAELKQSIAPLGAYVSRQRRRCSVWTTSMRAASIGSNQPSR